MARKNNKGFSVVEIVIAIAILSILLVPIVTQISQTFRTSRNAKKQQNVTDNAVYLMEDFQQASLDDLKDKYGTPTPTQVECQVYDKDGNKITGAVVKYNAYLYKPDDVELGTDKSNYKRTVVLDDLSACLMSYDAGGGKGYKIASSTTRLTGFDANEDNETSTYMYDDKGYVVGVVCELTDRISNPNEVNLGNMQDMDSSKVAIVAGTAANFDAQAENAFFSLAMDKLKETDYDSWEQAMLQVNNDSVLNQYGNLANTKKVTKIYIDKLHDDVKNKDYYLVSVDVTYKNEKLTDVLNYNVYSQKFYMDECPDVYFEYQPYAAESSKTSVIYSANDYILVDNYVDDAKIYLYKPFGDQMNVITTYVDPLNAPEHENGGTLYKFTQKNTPSSAPVTIHVCNATNFGKDAYIYTNIDKSTFEFDKFTAVPESESSKNSGSPRSLFDSDNLKQLSEDSRLQERLFTIHVTLKPEDDDTSSNEVRLTGAKGEN